MTTNGQKAQLNDATPAIGSAWAPTKTVKTNGTDGTYAYYFPWRATRLVVGS